MNKAGSYSTAVMMLLLGIVMIIFPEAIMNFICYLFAAAFIIAGLVKLGFFFKMDIKEAVFTNDFSMGIVMIVLGLIFATKANLIESIIPMIMGLVIVVNGIIKLQHAFNLKRIGSSSATFVLIISLLCIGIGVVLLFVPSTMSKIITIFIGIGFVVSGLTDLAAYFVVSKKLKTKEMAEETVANVYETVENPEVVEETDLAKNYEESLIENK